MWQTYLNKHRDRFLNELKELLRIPSISAQSDHQTDIQKAADWLANKLREVGLDDVQVMPTGGHPVVYGQWLKAGKSKPTLLIYGHYDVQSADPLNEWISDPFEPEIRDGNLYGRGTADDKGQLFAHIAAVETILATQKSLPVNIKFLIEGEEEIGGVNLDSFVARNKALLGCDACVISDSHSLSPSRPLIPYGLRSIVYFEISLSAMDTDVHSGTYGGNIPNVALELAQLLGKLKDNKTQKVLILGFYDHVRKLSPQEKQELDGSYFNQQTVKSETGVKQVIGIAGLSVAARAGAMPTLDVNGMSSGYTGEGPKTIIPAKASAKVSMRLVPHQTVAEIRRKFEKYVSAITPKYVDIKVQFHTSGEPILMSRDSVYFQKAETALKKTFGNSPIYGLEAASIPITAVLKANLGVDSVLLSFGLPDDGLHAPNEKFSLDMFYKGIATSIEYLSSF